MADPLTTTRRGVFRFGAGAAGAGLTAVAPVVAEVSTAAIGIIQNLTVLSSITELDDGFGMMIGYFAEIGKNYTLKELKGFVDGDPESLQHEDMHLLFSSIEDVIGHMEGKDCDIADFGEWPDWAEQSYRKLLDPTNRKEFDAAGGLKGINNTLTKLFGQDISTAKLKNVIRKRQIQRSLLLVKESRTLDIKEYRDALEQAIDKLKAYSCPEDDKLLMGLSKEKEKIQSEINHKHSQTESERLNKQYQEFAQRCKSGERDNTWLDIRSMPLAGQDEVYFEIFCRRDKHVTIADINNGIRHESFSGKLSGDLRLGRDYIFLPQQFDNTIMLHAKRPELIQCIQEKIGGLNGDSIKLSIRMRLPLRDIGPYREPG